MSSVFFEGLASQRLHRLKRRRRRLRAGYSRNGKDKTRQHAKTTLDMPKGSFLSTCQTSLSPSTWQKSVGRHAKKTPRGAKKLQIVGWTGRTVNTVDVKDTIESVPIDMPNDVNAHVDMPKRRATMANLYVGGDRRVVS